MLTNTPSQVHAKRKHLIKRTLRNYCKSRMYTKKPQNLSDLSITGNWTLYINERFLLCDSGLDSDERVIIFSFDDGLYH